MLPHGFPLPFCVFLYSPHGFLLIYMLFSFAWIRFERDAFLLGGLRGGSGAARGVRIVDGRTGEIPYFLLGGGFFIKHGDW